MSRARDSLELASLASSSPSPVRHSTSSSSAGAPSSRKLSFDNDDPLSTAQTTQPNSTRNIYRPARSYSVSSAFDFAAPVFPLSSTNGYTSLGGPTSLDPSIAHEAQSLEKNKTLTYLNGLSLIIGLIIGSGIFSSPSQVNKNAGSPGASLIIWAVAGLLAWTGATSYAELGGAMPLNGGAQMYLTKIFGHMTGFLYSWCTVCVLKPGSAALIAMIFGDYILRAIVGEDAGDLNPFISKGIALVGLALVTLLNATSTKLATQSANVFMFFKFLALLAVFVIGVIVAITGFSWEGKGKANTDWKEKNWFEGTNHNLSNIAVALYAGLWAYDGWDNVNYVTGELVNAPRDLPRVIHTSMPLVIVSYLLANVAYFLVLPLNVTFSSTTIATAVGADVLGGLGTLLMALMVSGSCFGALNATTFTSSRLFYAAAKEGYLPRVIGTLGWPFSSSDSAAFKLGTESSRMTRAAKSHNLFMTPIAALALNFAFTSVYILIGTFSTLLTFYGVAGYFFYFLTVLGLLVLRVQEPHLERPYRCWISTPIIFCCVSLFLLSRSVVAAPWTSFSVLPFLAVGTVVYFWKVKVPESGRRREEEDVGWRFWRRRWGRS